MTKADMTTVPQDNLLKAQNMMSRYRIKKVVVIDDENKRYPVGILTIKDIIRFLISDEPDRELYETPIAGVMTKGLTGDGQNRYFQPRYVSKTGL
jgi:CBS domain-containing protein